MYALVVTSKGKSKLVERDQISQYKEVVAIAEVATWKEVFDNWDPTDSVEICVKDKSCLGLECLPDLTLFPQFINIPNNYTIPEMI